jgi:uncharacterized membrane protein YdjX (TVP38/TMEM64 family)
MNSYLVVALVVFAVNLMPAFGPPTWAVLVVLHLSNGLAPVPLVVVGAAAAASGRLVLAVAFRHLGDHLPERYVTNAREAGRMVMASRKGSIIGLGLFALSPVSSAQLFEAAGLMSVRLVPLTLAFFAGRLVGYSLYMAGASAARRTSAGQLLMDSLTSPWAIGMELILLAGLVPLGRIDWAALRRKRTSPGR